MNAKLRLIIRVISRRVEDGEDLETVLLDYPKLTEEEKELIRPRIPIKK